MTSKTYSYGLVSFKIQTLNQAEVVEKQNSSNLPSDRGKNYVPASAGYDDTFVNYSQNGQQASQQMAPMPWTKCGIYLIVELKKKLQITQ